MRFARSGRIAGLFIAAGVAMAVFAGIPNRGPGQEVRQEPLKYEVNVIVKLIQVSVMDKQGRPVLDLVPADFEVTDNGKPVSIEHFEKHVFGSPEERLPAAEPAPEARRLNRKFFLLFDFAFLDYKGILRAKEAALHFLDTSLQPSDEVGLASYSPAKSLTLHEYLTTDHAKIRQIVEAFGLRSVVGRAENLLDYWVQQVQEDKELAVDMDESSVVGGQRDPFLTTLIRMRTQPIMGEDRRAGYVHEAIASAESLKALAGALRYIPGTKNVLFFSSGIARQVLYGKKMGTTSDVSSARTPEELAQSMSEYDDAHADSSVRDEYSKMLKEFKSANCTVYAFNSTRVRGEVDVEGMESTVGESRELSGVESLRQFSGETGGKYYSNTMDVRKAVEDLQNITGAFYVLGYPIKESWDGAFHKIKVKVARKGCEVQSQRGYYNPLPFPELSEFEKLMQLMDLALSDSPQFTVPISLSVAILPVRVGGWIQTAGAVRIPAANIKELLTKTSEVYLLVFDNKADAVAVKRFRVRDPAAGPDGTALDFVLPLKPGEYTCRVVVRNMMTGKGARGNAAVVVPAVSAEGLTLDPPLLLEETSNVASVSVVPEISLAKLYGYDPTALSPMAGDPPAGARTLQAALRCTGAGSASEVAIFGYIFDPETQSRTTIPLKILGQSKDGGTRCFRLEIPLGDLKPGRYNLDFVAQEAGGLNAHTAFQIILK